MDNQHKQIKGYRDLSQAEIDAMNRVKAKAEEVGRLIDELRSIPSLDQRWINVGATDLQKGFMSVVRGIAQPTSF
ncbi:Acb2/Tad1 domain-containing protein [Burkholderia cepacia]|uniref:Acb2/Tad1 domain-containing protein n=1 Tax=Burkholderia cepacia TaxID=292 RepID=UPI003EE15AFC